MTKAEAFKALRLDESADVQMVESAYWTLVRQAQGRVGRDPEAEHEIDRLNDAYAKLSPNGRGKPQPQRTRASVDAGTGVTALDNFADWCAEQALKTRQRWSERNPEIAMIGGCAIVLMFLALSSGASAISVLLVVALICVAIWSPWRRVRLPEDDAPDQAAESKRQVRQA